MSPFGAYLKVDKPKAMDLFRSWLKKDPTLAGIAAAAGVDVRTVYGWLKRYPELATIRDLYRKQI